jgi:fructose-bisphosphate aldolase, class I
MTTSNIYALIGEENGDLLSHTCETITKDTLHLPSPTFVDDVFAVSNRNAQTLGSLAKLYNTGRLAGTGYLSILPY